MLSAAPQGVVGEEREERNVESVHTLWAFLGPQVTCISIVEAQNGLDYLYRKCEYAGEANPLRVRPHTENRDL